MIRRYIRQYERLPRFYGFAWYDFPSRREVCYPIPLNWLAWAIRAVYWKLAVTPTTEAEKVLHRAEVEGREKGHKQGYKDGFEQGVKDHGKMLAEAMRS